MFNPICLKLVRSLGVRRLRIAWIALMAFGGAFLITGGTGHFPTPAQAATPSDSRLTIEQIGDALDKYGKNTMTTNGKTVYSLNTRRGKWDINVIVSLSPNGRVIWITNQLTEVPDAGTVPAAALIDILKKNQEIGPMFFSINRGSLRLSNPVPNHDLTADDVRESVEALVSTVVDTEPLWSPDTLSGHPSAPKSGNRSGNANPLSR